MSPIPVALVGCGHWGEKLARNLAALPAFRFAAACDTDADRARAVAERHGAERASDDPARTLGDGGITAVLIATPATSHEALVGLALDAGLHVLCEKPLVPSARRGAALLDRAVAAGRVLAVDHTELHSAPFHALRAALLDGVPGDWRTATLVHRTRAPGPPDVDAVWDLAPHDFAILEALGAGEVSAVEARAAGPGAAELAVRFASGRLAELRLARGADTRRRTLELRGTGGTIEVAGFRPGDALRRSGTDGTWETILPPDGVEPLRGVLEDFARRIGRGTMVEEEVAAERRILLAVERVSRAVAARRADGATSSGEAAAGPDAAWMR